MQVKLTQSLVTLSKAYGTGDLYECSSANEASRLVEAGIAVAVTKVAERAVPKTLGKEKRG